MTSIPRRSVPLAQSGGPAVPMHGSQEPNFTSNHALQDIDNLYGGRMMSPSPEPGYQQQNYMQPTSASNMQNPSRPAHGPGNSQSSLAPLVASRSNVPAAMHPLPGNSRESYGLGAGYDQAAPHSRSPYQMDGYEDSFDPQDIADDGGDGYEDGPDQRHSHPGATTYAGAAGVAGAGGAGAGMLKAFGARDASGAYRPVSNSGGDGEKSEWLRSQSKGNKRLKWIVGSAIVLLVIAAVVGGVVAGLLSRKHSSDGSGGSGSSSSSSSGDDDNLYNLHSSQVQEVLNNKNLHRVFPGMDYTPLNAQYPACLSVGPDQNNITLDVAVMSQLTPAIRLYGTDCNQTEMTLTAIDQLEMNDTMSIWLGVYLNGNQTTNTRQLNQMYDVLDKYDSSHFAALIIGNEVLFAKTLTAEQLGDILQEVRSNLTAKNINLPVATSDLGNDWTAGLVADSDIVMANVHPFFAGVTPDVAPGWTWSFWQEHDVELTGTSSANNGSYPKNIISETGWPSEGGNDCGTGTKCPTSTAGSVAGIDEMNSFMDGWVCQSLTNQTVYFWFEAFDEPWQAIYNTPSTGDYWEAHWGLMDVNRNLKSGIVIPDCGGQTMDKPFFS